MLGLDKYMFLLFYLKMNLQIFLILLDKCKYSASVIKLK